MGLLRATVNPFRLTYTHYLHRNIPAATNGLRWYSTSKKIPTKNGTVNNENNRKYPIAKKKLQPCPPLTIYPQQTIKSFDNNNKTIKTGFEKMKKKEPAPEVFTANKPNNQTKPMQIPVHVIAAATPIRDYATNTACKKPAPPPPSFTQSQSQQPATTQIPTGGASPEPGSNNYWWLLLVAAAAGGLTLVYHNDLFGISEKAIPLTELSTKKSKYDDGQKRIPESSADIPKEIPYLLIGGGTASFAAFRAIKSHDPKAKVMVISKEIEMPYMRPPLSKELWLSTDSNIAVNSSEQLKFKQWNGVERSLYYEPNDFYINPEKLLEEPNGGVAIVQGYAVKHVDVFNRKAVLTDGTEIQYGECLLATGSSPKNLDVFESAPLKVRDKVSLFKTIEDFENLKQTITKAKSVAIVGGGFLGSELACALAKYGEGKNLKIHQIFHEKGNMGKVLPEFLSEWTTDRVREEGVNVLTKTQVTGVELINNQLKLKLIDGQNVLCDHVVVAIGSEPNISLAQDSGLEIDEKYGGYLVNAELEARRHLYVAGDAACFYDPKLGRRRVEHHDHAVVSGRLAGENMVGLKKPYTHQSMFWSDLGPKVGYEAIGIIDSTLPTVSVFAKRGLEDENPATDESTSNEAGKSQPTDLPTPHTVDNVQANTDDAAKQDDFGKGVIFYLRDEKIIGIVLWNVFNRINTARAVISENKKYDDLNEVAKLFEIHS